MLLELDAFTTLCTPVTVLYATSVVAFVAYRTYAPPSTRPTRDHGDDFDVSEGCEDVLDHWLETRL